MPSRPLLHALLGMALLVQGLLPLGWMPAFAADGLRLVPCSSYWPEEFAFAASRAVGTDAHQAHSADDLHKGHGAAPSHHGSDEEDEQKAATSTCAFAGSPGVAPPAFSATVQPTLSDRRMEPTPDQPAEIGRGLAAPPPPSTGPPSAA